MLMYFDEELTLFDAYSGNVWCLCVCCTSGNVFSISNCINVSSVAFKFPSLGPRNSLWVELAPSNSETFLLFPASYILLHNTISLMLHSCCFLLYI